MQYNTVSTVIAPLCDVVAWRDARL